MPTSASTLSEVGQKRKREDGVAKPRTTATVPVVTTSNPNWEALRLKLGIAAERKVKKGGSDAYKKQPDKQTAKVVPSHIDGPLAAAFTVIAPYKIASQYVAVDCEMVGVGPEGTQDALARVSLVDYNGVVLYDKFVQPKEKVTDWRTFVSGILPQHMKHAVDFETAQKDVSVLLKDKVVVGHSLKYDMKALLLSHDRNRIRDTAKFTPLKGANGKAQALRKIVKKFLSLDIQSGSHSSVEDARAVMLVYRHMRDEWEKEIKEKMNRGKSQSKKKSKVAKEDESD